jgi:hypothetical protein
MASFDELMQSFVNTEYDELVAQGKQALVHILPACAVVDPDHNGALVVVSILLATMACDGRLPRSEIKYLQDILETDEDRLEKMIDLYKTSMEDFSDHFADKLNDELKAHVMILICAAASADKTITIDENEFIQRIMA